jgi:acyl-CoA thioester hydrolase
MHHHEARVRVRYAETDQMGVVYYANYFIWMEVGRVEYCRSIGLLYKEMERNDGILLAVVEANCRYLSPARYDEEVVVKTWVEQANTRMLRFAYEMRVGGEDRVLAKGETKHLYCDRDLRPVRLPGKYHHLFGVV